MKFSIIVPVYNSENMIKKCIESVINQTCADWELIIVNDGSEDKSGLIADCYAKEESRIKVIHKLNEGQLYARREGVQKARGNYILFLDSDDYWEYNCLEIITEKIEQFNPDILMFTCRTVGNTLKEKRILGQYGENIEWIDKVELYKRIISSHSYNSMCLKVFKKELFDNDENNYESLKGIGYGEDKIQTLHPITNAKKILFIPNVLYNYVYNEQSSVHKIDFKKIPVMISKEMFEFTYKYMKLWELNDEMSIESIGVYYLKNLLQVYYGIRKQCDNKELMRMFYRYPWRNYIDKRAFRYIFSKKLKAKEKIKLIWIYKSLY